MSNKSYPCSAACPERPIPGLPTVSVDPIAIASAPWPCQVLLDQWESMQHRALQMVPGTQEGKGEKKTNYIKL